MCQCDFSRLELPPRKEQFMLQEARVGLLLVRLTRELARQDVDSWKREASYFSSRLRDPTIHGLCQDGTYFSQLTHLGCLASEP